MANLNQPKADSEPQASVPVVVIHRSRKAGNLPRAPEVIYVQAALDLPK